MRAEQPKHGVSDSASQPAPGHSRLRSQPERDRCQRRLPDHSVPLLGAGDNLPDIGLLSVTHTHNTITHTLSSKVRIGSVSHLSQRDRSGSVSIVAVNSGWRKWLIRTRQQSGVGPCSS